MDGDNRVVCFFSLLVLSRMAREYTHLCGCRGHTTYVFYISDFPLIHYYLFACAPIIDTKLSSPLNFFASIPVGS